MVRDSGFRGFGVSGFGFRGSGFEFRVQGLPATLCTSSTSDENASVSDPARAPAVTATRSDLLWRLGCRVSGLGFRASDLRFRVSGLGIRIWGAEFLGIEGIV